MSYKKICATCGKEFEAQRKTGMYCSPECKRKMYSKKEHERSEKNRKVVTKICRFCGKPFQTTTKQKFLCSKECSAAYSKKRAHDNSIVIGWQDMEQYNKGLEHCRWCGKPFKPFSDDGGITRGKFFCECRCATAFTHEVWEKARENGGNYGRATFETLSERAKKNGSDYAHYQKLYEIYLMKRAKMTKREGENEACRSGRGMGVAW